MPERDTIVIGASAGGVEALRSVLGALPGDLPAVVLIVLHTPPSGVNALAAILSRSTELEVVAAEQGTALKPGTVVVARPDHHLMVVDDHVMLTRGPRENGHRPAVDVLFRSAARARGPRVIGVVLSGSLDDGSAGLVAVRSRGGIGVVQDPDEALSPGMPRNAIEAAHPEHVETLDGIGRRLAELVGAPVRGGETAPPGLMEAEVAMAELDPDALRGSERPGHPAGLSCPDCHGTLFEIDEHGFVRYRCRVGHAWSAESLLAESDASIEGALWMALRSLEEKAALAVSMAERARGAGRSVSGDRFAIQAQEVGDAAAVLRRLLETGAGRGLQSADDGEGQPV